VPHGRTDCEWKRILEKLYLDAGLLIENGHFKEALESIFAAVRLANKTFDERKPWVQLKENPEDCRDTLHTCVQIIVNLANLLQPFLPFSCGKIRSFLALEQPAWTFASVLGDRQVNGLQLLFERIDASRIEEETLELEKYRL